MNATDLSGFLTPEFREVAYDTFFAFLPAVVTLAAGWYIGRNIKSTVEENIKGGFFLSSEAPLQKTYYAPSGILNSKGEELLDQRIRPIGDDPTVDISNLFPANVRKKISQYLLDACEDVVRKAKNRQKFSVMPLDHLEFVVPKSEFKNIQGLIKAKMQTATGTTFKGSGKNDTPFDPRKREIPEVENHVAAIVFEPGIERREIKLLRFKASELENADNFPPEHLIRFQTQIMQQGGNKTVYLTNEEYKKRFQTSEDHPQLQRIHTIKAIAEAFKSGNCWHLVPAEIETGRVVRIPEPAGRRFDRA